MRVLVVMDIEKEKSNEVEGDGWKPGPNDFASAIRKGLVGKDFDTGWVITAVTGLR